MALPGLPAADTGRTRKTNESGSVPGLEKSPICVVDEKFLLRPHVLACDDTVVSFKGFYCGNRELVSSFFPPFQVFDINCGSGKDWEKGGVGMTYLASTVLWALSARRASS